MLGGANGVDGATTSTSSSSSPYTGDDDDEEEEDGRRCFAALLVGGAVADEPRMLPVGSMVRTMGASLSPLPPPSLLLYARLLTPLLLGVVDSQGAAPCNGRKCCWLLLLLWLHESWRG